MTCGLVQRGWLKSDTHPPTPPVFMPRSVKATGTLALCLLLPCLLLFLDLVLDRPFGSFTVFVSSWIPVTQPRRHQRSSSRVISSTKLPSSVRAACRFWCVGRPQKNCCSRMTIASRRIREWPPSTSSTSFVRMANEDDDTNTNTTAAAVSRSNLRFEEIKSSSHANSTKARTKHVIARFYRRHYLPIRDSKQENIQCSLWMTKQPDGSSNPAKSITKTNTTEEKLLATVRLCFVRDENDAHSRTSSELPEWRPKSNSRTTSSAKEWTWLRSLCVHTSFRQQGWARDLIQRTLIALRRHYHLPQNVPPVYCFAQAALGSSLYLPLGFRRVDLDITPTTVGAATTAMKQQPNSLQQKYRTMVRRLSHKSESNTLVDLECYSYNIPDETTVNHHRILSSVSSSPVNVLILQHERESSRKTGTAQLLLENAYHTQEQDDSAASIRGLHVTTMTWSGRIDNPKVERLLRANQQPQDYKPIMILLWTDGSADLSSLLRDASNSDVDEKNGRFKLDEVMRTTAASSSVTFIVIDATRQEAKTMFRKIPALRNLPRWSIRPTQASRYRLRQDYGWKNKFALGSSGNDNFGCSSKANDNEDHPGNSLLCTAEVVAELLQQTGNIEGAEIVRRRLDSFMNKLRPVAVPNSTVG